MKEGDTAEFIIDAPEAMSRIQCRMAASYAPSFPPPTPLDHDGYPSYRQSSLATYQYPIKYYSTSFGDYADENVDYGIHNNSQYQMMSPEHLAALPSGSIYPAPGPRGWPATPASFPRNNSFYEPESSYTHGQYHASGYPLRPTLHPTMQPEPKHGLSLSGMANALPNPITNIDRLVLPPPPVHRQPGHPLRSSESMSALQGPQISRSTDGFTYHDGIMGTSTFNTVKSVNSHAVSENASVSTTYLPLANNVETLPAPQMGNFNSQAIPSQQQNEMYTPSSADSSSLFSVNLASSMDGNRSSEYLPSSSSKRPSVSHGTDRTGSSSDYSPKLTNGRIYEPHNQGFYPAPPMATGIPTMELPIQRRVSGVQTS